MTVSGANAGQLIKVKKFVDADITADGQQRASVPLLKLETLWFNTGTLCNIECVNCYIESSPKNDRLVYMRASEVSEFLNEIESSKTETTEIGFTGGEPFMNPEIMVMIEECLNRGFKVLVLTNAMQPMMRKRVRDGLMELKIRYADVLTLRVSMDHYTPEFHEKERGPNTWDVALKGLKWLSDNDFNIDVAGRTCWGEDEAAARKGYAELFKRENIRVDAPSPTALVLFPEMDEQAEVPEITTSCWSILGKRPEDIMCATSRMVVKRKGAAKPVVLSCTLLPYDPQFELGATLSEASGPVKLNHPHCAKFCVLGGASCSPPAE